MRTDTRIVLEIDFPRFSYQFIFIYKFNGLKFFGWTRNGLGKGNIGWILQILMEGTWKGQARKDTNDFRNYWNMNCVQLMPSFSALRVTVHIGTASSRFMLLPPFPLVPLDWFIMERKSSPHVPFFNFFSNLIFFLTCSVYNDARNL